MKLCINQLSIINLLQFSKQGRYMVESSCKGKSQQFFFLFISNKRMNINEIFQRYRNSYTESYLTHEKINCSSQEEEFLKKYNKSRTNHRLKTPNRKRKTSVSCFAYYPSPYLHQPQQKFIYDLSCRF